MIVLESSAAYLITETIESMLFIAVHLYNLNFNEKKLGYKKNNTQNIVYMTTKEEIILFKTDTPIKLNQYYADFFS